MLKNIFIILLFIIILVVGWLFLFSNNTDDNIVEKKHKNKITIYKSPTCGCCIKYTAYLKEKGYDIKTITTQNMSAIKNQHQIPSNMESCHTAIIDNYFVEGHVPVEAVEKLLTEKPDIDGISLPEMPAGTPGMPGTKQGDWQIYSLKNNQISEYMSL